MNRSNELKKAIRSIIIKKNENFDNKLLHDIFDSMSDNKLLNFWIEFTRDRAILYSWNSAPHWQVTHRDKIFEIEANKLREYPTIIDNNGKRLVNKIDLENYIVEKINDFVLEEKKQHKANKELPFISKLTIKVNLLAAILLPFAIICLILLEFKRFEDYARVCLIFFSIIYGLTFVLTIIKELLKRKDLK